MEWARTYPPLRNNWQCLYFYILSFGQMKCRHVHVASLSAYLAFLNQKSPYCTLIGGFCTGESLFSTAVCLKRECLWHIPLLPHGSLDLGKFGVLVTRNKRAAIPFFPAMFFPVKHIWGIAASDHNNFNVNFKQDSFFSFSKPKN